MGSLTTTITASGSYFLTRVSHLLISFTLFPAAFPTSENTSAPITAFTGCFIGPSTRAPTSPLNYKSEAWGTFPRTATGREEGRRRAPKLPATIWGLSISLTAPTTSSTRVAAGTAAIS